MVKVILSIVLLGIGMVIGYTSGKIDGFNAGVNTVLENDYRIKNG